MAGRQPRIRLVLDFDGTITIDDTTAVIGARCLAKARELARADLRENELPKPMEYYSEKYMQEYSDWKKTFTRSERKTVDDEVSYLSQSRHVERDSYLRVKNAILDVPGVRDELERNETARNEFMASAGRQAVRSGEVQIRDPQALQSLIAKAEDEGNFWGIVSVSWSRRFILGALIEAGLAKEDQSEDIVPNIKCNEILAPDNVDGQGKPAIICSAQDKLNALHEILAGWDQERQHPANSKDDKAVITIYVGDSSTDIGCLTGPAIGMYLQQGDRANDSVVQLLKDIGIECLPIDRSLISSTPSKILDMKSGIEEARIVCSVKGFQEIDQWVSNLLRNP